MRLDGKFYRLLREVRENMRSKIEVKNLSNTKIKGLKTGMTLIVSTLLTITSLSVVSVNAVSPYDTYTSSDHGVKLKDLSNREFYGADVRMNGKSFSLAGEEKLRVKFTSKTISFRSNCNTMSGSYRLKGGSLLVSKIGSSKMACTKDLMNDDEWVRKFIGSNPKITLMSDIHEESKIVNGNFSSFMSIQSYVILSKGRSSIKLVIMSSPVAGLPIKDPNIADESITKQVCAEIIAKGMSEKDGSEYAVSKNLSVRITARDGEEYPATADYSVSRINFRVKDNKIVSCTQG